MNPLRLVAPIFAVFMVLMSSGASAQTTPINLWVPYDVDVQDLDAQAPNVGLLVELYLEADTCAAGVDIPVTLVARASVSGQTISAEIGRSTIPLEDVGCPGPTFGDWVVVAATWQGSDYLAFADAVTQAGADWHIDFVIDPRSAAPPDGLLFEGGTDDVEFDDNSAPLVFNIRTPPPRPGPNNRFIIDPQASGDPTWDGPVIDSDLTYYPWVSYRLGAQTCDNVTTVPVELRAVATHNGTPIEVVLQRKDVPPSRCGTSDLGTSATLSPDWRRPGVAEFITLAKANNLDWRLAIVVDPTPPGSPAGTLIESVDPFFEVAENRLDLQTIYPASSLPLPFSRRLRLGGAVAEAVGGDLNGSGYYCFNGGAIRYAPTGGWTAASVPNISICGVLSEPTPEGYDLVINSGTTSTFNLTGGQLAGLDTTLIVGLEPLGLRIYNAYLTLPRGHGMHGGDPDSGPKARGRRTIEVSAGSLPPVASPAAAGFTLVNGYVWFTAETSPVAVGGLYPYLADGAIHFSTPPDVHYRFDQDYQRYDPRNIDKDGPASNDIRFRSAEAIGGNTVIVDGALTFNLQLAAGEGQTAYPRGRLKWGANTLPIAEATVAPTQSASATPATFTVAQSPACPACGGADGPIPSHDLTLVTDILDPTGRLVSRTDAVDVEWGPRGVNGTASRVFKRVGDNATRAIVNLPGWIFEPSGTATNLADQLAGPVLLADDIIPLPLSHASAQAGNGFFPGLTIGPEIYRDADGQPFPGRGSLLSDTSFDIAIGGPAKPYRRVDSSPGTKLVVTPAGVTGAFNFDAGPSLGNIYGYPFSLTRFAFRTVRNQTDDFTWLDGNVRVEGKADFAAPFRSLVLQCSGHFAGGQIDFAALTPQRLRAWNSRFDLATLAFTAEAIQGQCSTADRRLTVGGGMRIEAFDKSLDLTATWLPDGSTVGLAKLAGDPHVEFDRPASGTHSDGSPRRGFQVALGEAALESRACIDSDHPTTDACGWFKFGGTVGLPFWNALPATLRATNVRGAGGSTFAAGRTLVAKAGYNPAGWLSDRLDQLLVSAKGDVAAGFTPTFNWAFDVTLPARWAYDAPANEYPRFVADPLVVAETDLKVLKVKGAVPFITEHNTRIDFGASADLSKLEAANVALSVDLTNKEDVKKIDAFIAKIIPGVGTPVESAVGLLQNPAGALLKVTGSGFDNFIGAAIKGAMESEQIVTATDGVASALSAVQRLPLTLADQIFAELKSGIDEAVTGIVGQVVSGPNTLALDLYNQIPNKWVAALNAYKEMRSAAGNIAPQAWNSLRDTFDTLRKAVWPVLALLGDSSQAGVVGALGKAEQGVDAAITAVQAARDAVTVVGGKVTGLLDEARSKLGYVTGTVLNIDNVNSPLSILKCPTSNVTANPLIAQLNSIEGHIKSLTETLANKALEKLGKLIGGPLGVDLTFLKTADFYFSSVAAALTRIALGEPNNPAKKGFIGKVKDFICDTKETSPVQRLRGIVLKAKAFLEPIKVQLDALATPVPCNVTPAPAGGSNISKLACTVLHIRTALTELEGPADAKNDVPGKITLRGLKRQLADTYKQVNALRQKLEFFKTVEVLPESPPVDAAAFFPDPASFGVDLTVPEIQAYMNQLGRFALEAMGFEADELVGFAGWVDNAGAPTTSFISKLPDAIRKPINEFIAVIQAEVGLQLSGALSKLPFPTGKQIRETITKLLMESAFVEQLDKLFHEGMAFVLGELNSVGLAFLQQVNELIKKVIAKFNEVANQLLQGAVSTIKETLGFSAVGITGSAVIQEDEIERLRLEATFSLNKSKEPATPSNENKSENASEFKAYLEAISWKVNGKAKNCIDASGDLEGGAPLDVKIGAQNLPFKFGANNGMSIKKLELGFTLASQSGDLSPIGFFGGVETAGKLSFKAFELSDIAIALGGGRYENYLGAKARANFQGTVLQVAFLAGELCNLDVLNTLDPLAATFLKAPEGGAFKGAYVRGSASFPFINLGCLLQAGATADVGAWVFGNDQGQWTIGGLVAGGIYGKAICLVSAKGKVTLAGQYANNSFSFLGTGWIGGGFGFCEPEEWNTPEDVANDGMCGTATASLTATYVDSKFKVSDPKFSGLD